MTGVITLIIGLESGYRGSGLEAQLESVGMFYERVRGVVGQFRGLPVSAYTDKAAAVMLYGRELRSGEIGCALAHRECYTRLLETEAEWALIFEDDAVIADEESLRTAHALINGLAAIRDPAVIMLYGRRMSSDSRRQTSIAGRRIVRLAQTPTTTTAYYINRSAASLILESGLPLRNPADWPASVEGIVDFFGIYPWLAVPDEVQESSIGNRGGDKREGWVRLRHRAEAVTFIKWIKNRSLYSDVGEYWRWEVRRPLVALAVGINLPYRLPDGAIEIPRARRFAILLDKLLGARQRFAVINELEHVHDVTPPLPIPDGGLKMRFGQRDGKAQ